jgi:redox-sensitive bicupin YhaK (pirin superfamily)
VPAIEMPAGAVTELRQAWERLPLGRRQLTPSFEAFQEFVREVLSKDIRALRKRLPKAEAPGRSSSPLRVDVPEVYHVHLLDIDIRYHMRLDGRVEMQGAMIMQCAAAGGDVDDHIAAAAGAQHGEG